MNLKFELPEREKNVVSEWIKKEDILYCVPFDIDNEGKYADGWLVISSSQAVIINNGIVERHIRISECRDFKQVNLVGNGMLEGVVDGEVMPLVRYSMKHVPRYTYIAKILNSFSKGESSKIKSLEDEDICPRCGRNFLTGTKICTNCSNRIAAMKRLFSVAKPYWYMYLIVVATFWISAGLSLISPRLYRALTDDVLMVKKKDLSLILLIVLGIAACSILSMIISMIRGWIMAKAGGRLSMDLKAMVYSKIQALSLNYLDQKETGQLMNRVTGDTNRIQSFLQDTAVSFLNETILLIGVFIILFAYNWKLALLVMIPMPFVFVFCKLIWGWIRRRFHSQFVKWDRLNSLLQDILSGIRVVKAFGQEEREISRFREKNRELADISTSNEKYWNTIFPLIGFALSIGNFLVLYYGGKLVLEKSMTLGELIQFSTYAGYVYGPLRWLSFMPRWFNEAMTATERVFEIIDEEPDIMDRSSAIKTVINGKVEFKDVTFGYKSHEPVLDSINVTVEKGEMIGLVGHSGAGKSTFINLLMRLYDVDEGQILIDGIDIRDLSQEDLRSQIGVVLQETFLFSGTIHENIMYSKPDATPDEVIRAAKIANAHDFIMRFPDGYDTKVGEKGQRLSGGERQRIAIARAILNNPKILILDEATASVDTETEQQIQEALGRLIKNRTTFAIAHRLSTLKNADRIMVIDQGKLAELGTHEELMNKKGIYYRLVMAQNEMSKIKGI